MNTVDMYKHIKHIYTQWMRVSTIDMSKQSGYYVNFTDACKYSGLVKTYQTYINIVNMSKHSGYV